MMNSDEITQLLDNKEKESRSLDYKDKKIIKGNTDRLVKDIVAMAHSEGGKILVGVEEDNEEPSNVQSVGDDDFSLLRRKVTDKITDNVSGYLDPNVSHESYRGSEFNNGKIAVIEVKQTNELLTYTHKKPAIPYRFKDKTDYMDAQQIKKFVKEDIRPAYRARHAKEDEDSLKEPKIEQPYEEAEPYYFSKKDGSLWTFHGMFNDLGDSFMVRSSPEVRNIEDLQKTLKAAMKHFDVDLKNASFTVSQRNCQWFGRGAQNFVQTIEEQKERYDIKFDVDTHHSESALLLADIPRGIFAISIEPVVQRRSEENLVLKYFNVAFSYGGIPIDTRAVNRFMDEIGMKLTPGHQVNSEQKNLPLPKEEIKLQPTQKLTENNSFNNSKDSWVSAIVCKNPFHQEPHLLNDLDIPDRFYSIKNVENVLCRLKDHHPIEEDREYVLRRARIRAMTELSPDFRATNLSLLGTYLNDSKYDPKHQVQS